MLKSLRVDKHPDKTWIGHAKRSFDFFRFRITPASIRQSTTGVSRRDKQVALYEQGASKRRIGLYLGRWLAWGILVGCSTTAAQITTTVRPTPADGAIVDLPCTSSTGSQIPNCTHSIRYVADPLPQTFIDHNPAFDLCRNMNFNPFQNTFDSLASAPPSSPSTLLSSLGSGTGTYGVQNSTANFLASTPTACIRQDTSETFQQPTNQYHVAIFPPVLDLNDAPFTQPLVPTSPIDVLCPVGSTYADCYATATDAYNNATCTGPAEFNGTCGIISLSAADSLLPPTDIAQGFSVQPPIVTPTNPQNIPVFGPFGLLAMLSGLLWFGNRRRKS